MIYLGRPNQLLRDIFGIAKQFSGRVGWHLDALTISRFSSSLPSGVDATTLGADFSIFSGAFEAEHTAVAWLVASASPKK